MFVTLKMHIGGGNRPKGMSTVSGAPEFDSSLHKQLIYMPPA